MQRIVAEKWEKKSERLPSFSAAELSESYRGLFTPRDEFTAMDSLLAKHMEYKARFNPTTLKLKHEAVINTSNAKLELERKIRIEGLDWLERFKARRAFRSTVDRLRADGATRSLSGNKITLSFEQQRHYYSFDVKPGNLGYKTLDILSEARRQTKESSIDAGQDLIYKPEKDPLHTERKGEFDALRREGLVQRQSDGSYLVNEKYVRATIKRYQADYNTIGTRLWARRCEYRFAGIADDLRVGERDYLLVSIKGNKARKVSPLTTELSPSTQEKYDRVAENISPLNIEEKPLYLANRANQVTERTWWIDHVVIRRQVRSLELSAKRAGDDSLRNSLYQIRRGVESMKYSELRSEPIHIRPEPSHTRDITDEAFSRLWTKAYQKGDIELADSLQIAKATGLRPHELDKGVRLEQSGNSVILHITTAKKGKGVEGAERFQADRGIDRVIDVAGGELSDIAWRHGGFFRPQSSKDELRNRLQELRRDVEGADHTSFYTFRHAYKRRLEEQGLSPEEIAYRMGHLSERSQKDYGR